MGVVDHVTINHLGGSPLQGGVYPKVEMAELACADHLRCSTKGEQTIVGHPKGKT